MVLLLEKLIVLQLVMKFPAFHGTRRFITTLTSVRHLSLSWANPIQSTSHLLEIRRNIIHQSTPMSPQWSLSLRFPHQNPVYTSSLPISDTLPCPSITRTISLTPYINSFVNRKIARGLIRTRRSMKTEPQTTAREK